MVNDFYSIISYAINVSLLDHSISCFITIEGKLGWFCVLPFAIQYLQSSATVILISNPERISLFLHLRFPKSFDLLYCPLSFSKANWSFL